MTATVASNAAKMVIWGYGFDGTYYGGNYDGNGSYVGSGSGTDTDELQGLELVLEKTEFKSSDNFEGAKVYATFANSGTQDVTKVAQLYIGEAPIDFVPGNDYVTYIWFIIRNGWPLNRSSNEQYAVKAVYRGLTSNIEKITVTEDVGLKVRLESLPIGRLYNFDQRIDLTGLKVTCTDEEGNKEDVTADVLMKTERSGGTYSKTGYTKKSTFTSGDTYSDVGEEKVELKYTDRNGTDHRWRFGIETRRYLNPPLINYALAEKAFESIDGYSGGTSERSMGAYPGVRLDLNEVGHFVYMDGDSRKVAEESWTVDYQKFNMYDLEISQKVVNWSIALVDPPYMVRYELEGPYYQVYQSDFFGTTLRGVYITDEISGGDLDGNDGRVDAAHYTYRLKRLIPNSTLKARTATSSIVPDEETVQVDASGEATIGFTCYVRSVTEPDMSARFWDVPQVMIVNSYPYGVFVSSDPKTTVGIAASAPFYEYNK